MDFGIAGRVALISGADSGIGFATAEMLLAEGVKLVVTDVDQDRLDKAVAELGAPAADVLAVAADITVDADVDRLAANVQERFGDLDILVQAAGITGAQGLFHEIDQDGWRRTIEVDLLGPVRVLRAFLPGLRRGGWGRIVLLASKDAVQPLPTSCPTAPPRPAFWRWPRG